MNTRQTIFLNRVQQTASALVNLQSQIDLLGQSWFEEFSTGTNQILDSDLTSGAYGFTVTDLARILNVRTQLNNFWTGAAVTAGMNGQWVRRISSDI